MLGRVASGSLLPPTIRQLLSVPTTDARVQVNGWVKSIRRQKNIAFAVISDGSSARPLQAVIRDVSLAKAYACICSRLLCCTEGPSCSRRLTNGASVRLGGVLADSPGKGQDKELRVEEVEILGACDPAVCFITLGPLTKLTECYRHIPSRRRLSPPSICGTTVTSARGQAESPRCSDCVRPP